MNLFKVAWTRGNEKMYGEVYASSKDIALNALGLDSKEWSEAKVSSFPYHTPKDGDVSFIENLNDVGADLNEEEW